MIVRTKCGGVLKIVRQHSKNIAQAIAEAEEKIKSLRTEDGTKSNVVLALERAVVRTKALKLRLDAISASVQSFAATTDVELHPDDLEIFAAANMAANNIDS